MPAARPSPPRRLLHSHAVRRRWLLVAVIVVVGVANAGLAAYLLLRSDGGDTEAEAEVKDVDFEVVDEEEES